MKTVILQIHTLFEGNLCRISTGFLPRRLTGVRRVTPSELEPTVGVCYYIYRGNDEEKERIKHAAFIHAAD